VLVEISGDFLRLRAGFSGGGRCGDTEVAGCGADFAMRTGPRNLLCFLSAYFTAPIPVRTGEIVERDGFVFADVLPDPV